MNNGQWRPKPGDRFFRPRRIGRYRLRRVLGVAALFSAGYGDVGSSIYYALGVVALIALGATPIVLAIAGILYVFNALTYAEGGAMIAEAGGSASFARHSFNDVVGFIAGWSLMLSYIATMAISAYTMPPYLSYFWPALKDPVIGTATSMGIVLFLVLINVLGVRESSRFNIYFIAVDIATQITLIILGFILVLIPKPANLIQHMFGTGNWPSIHNLLFGIAIAALSFTGVETVAELAEEAHHPQKSVPRAYMLMIVAVLVLFAGISVVALAAMTPQMLGDPVNGWARDPVAGIANAISNIILPQELAMRIASSSEVIIILTWFFTGLRNALPVLVALLAASILFTATNAGLLGISRISFNLSKHRQLPGTLSYIHRRFRTPYVTIALFGALALLLLVPGFFAPNFFVDLGALYVFGSLLTFALAHASLLALRVKSPDLPRPFRLGLNIRIKGRALPLTAILGCLGTLTVWIVVIINQPYSRWVGLGWMVGGLILYSIYRSIKHLPLTYLKEDLQPSGVQSEE